MMTEVEIFSNKRLEKNNSKYELTYSNQYYNMKHENIKDTRIRWTYSD